MSHPPAASTSSSPGPDILEGGGWGTFDRKSVTCNWLPRTNRKNTARQQCKKVIFQQGTSREAET